MSKSIIVSNIPAASSEKEVRNFFGFAGKITEVELKREDNSDNQIAYITFEKEEEVRTSLILNKSVMGSESIIVKSADEVNNEDAYSEGDENFQLEGKPNESHILVGILAAGYQLQDTILETGSGIDAKLGVSERLNQYLSQLTAKIQELNEKYKVVETVVHKASEIDNKFSVQDKVRSYASQAQDKASQALNTEPGKYAQELYTNTYKQINVIQLNARKIADNKKAKIGGNINGGIEAH